MKKLLTRALSGAIYVALIVVSLIWGGSLGFTALCCLFALAGMLEFLRMTKGDLTPHRLTSAIDILIGMSLVASIGLSDMSLTSILFILGEICTLILIRAVMQLYVRLSDPVKDIALSIASVAYIALPLMAATGLNYIYGPSIMLLIFVMIWLNDTGAYLVGSTMGRHRLFERLSPKKSWEGFWGGLVFCVIAGWLAKAFLPQYFAGHYAIYLILGIIVNVFATWGDLFESMIKRNAGVKDSGNLIPGHGGILDRIDSILFVVPAATIYLYFMTLLF